jgi:hypothetical protein
LYSCTLVAAVILTWFSVAEELPSQVPSLIRFNGTLRDASVDQSAPTAELVFTIYADQSGSTPLWQEQQTVALDANRRYTILLGSASEGGVPRSIFATNDGRWLGIRAVDSSDEEKVLLVSVPYAFKAQDADTVGGRSADSFVSAAAFEEKLSIMRQPAAAAEVIEPQDAVFEDPTPLNNYKWLQLIPTQASSGKFNGTFYNFPQANDPTQDNWVMRLGYNIDKGGGPDNGTKPVMALEWESNYAPAVGTSVQEFHLSWVNIGATIKQRPITFFRTPTLGSLGFNNDLLILGDVNNNVKAYFGQGKQYDWFMGFGTPQNGVVHLLRAANNPGAPSGTLKFQMSSTLPYWSFGGFRVASALGQIALGTLAPRADTTFLAPVAPDKNGIDLFGSPGYYFRGRTSTGTQFLVDGSGNLTAAGNVASRTITVGGGTPVSGVARFAPLLTPQPVLAGTCAEQTFLLPGIKANDMVLINGPAPVPGTGIYGARVSAAGTVAINFCNLSPSVLTPASGIYYVKTTTF